MQTLYPIFSRKVKKLQTSKENYLANQSVFETKKIEKQESWFLFFTNQGLGVISICLKNGHTYYLVSSSSGKIILNLISRNKWL